MIGNQKPLKIFVPVMIVVMSFIIRVVIYFLKEENDDTKYLIWHIEIMNRKQSVNGTNTYRSN